MGMRCLLIAVNTTDTPYPVYPLGMAHVAGALSSNGHLVKQLDKQSCKDDYFPKLQTLLTEFNPEMIGISIRNLDLEDSAHPQSFMAAVRESVVFIKKHCKAPIVLGGPAFSLLPEKILEYLDADYGIVGEGEHALPWLARQIIKNTPPVERIIYNLPKKHPWQQVEYDQKICSHYTKVGGMMNLQTKRGCPYKCNYCSYPLLEGKILRKRDPQEVAEQALRLKQKFGARYLFFTDSVFNDTENHYLDICEALVQKNVSLPWTAYFRPTDIKPESMKLMKLAGLDAMEIGTDSGCNETLSALDKNFIFEDAIKLNQCAVNHEIPCAHFIMFGGPGENQQTLQQSLTNLEKLKKSVVFAFNGIRILPKTGIHFLAIEQGIIDKDDDLLEPKFYFSPNIDSQKIDTELLRQWKNRPDRIYPSSDGIDLIQQFHKKGHAGPIWDKIIRMGLAHG